MANTNDTQSFRMGPLPSTHFKNEQERADAIAAAMIGSTAPGAPGSPGATGAGATGVAGKDGTQVTYKEETIAIASGATSASSTQQLSGKLAQLVNDVDAAPGAWIVCIRGSTVIFNIATETANYKLHIGWYELS